MNFIKELQEARMTRDSRNQRLLTYNDCKEKAYLTLLCLQAMRYYRKHKTDTMKYSYKTVMYRDYDKFRIDSTDLYNLFYFITGDEAALKKLKDPGSASKERKSTLISVGKLNGFLRSMASGNKVDSADITFLATIESELGITNTHYRQIRRRLNSFDTDTQAERKTTITRLLFAARSRLSDSDIMPMFSRFTSDNNLEDFTATDPEPKISIPDISGMLNVQNYRLLLPVNSLAFVSQFLSIIQSGKTVPANIAAAYLPLVLMIHDIIKAGPAYIDQLKILHKRAKRDLK